MNHADTVPGQFRKVVSEHPDCPALIEEETQYSYRDLAAMVSAYAGLFGERLGLSPGQVLIAWLNNGPEFVASFLAAAEIGAVLFPLNIHWRPAELCWFLDRLPVAGVATKLALRDPWDALADRISPASVVAVDDPSIRSRLLPASRTASLSPNTPRISPDRPVVYLSSSGSTGVPKIVPRSHRNTVEGVAGTAHALGITAGLRFLSAVPFYHGNGLDNSLSLPLFTGGTAVLQSHFVPSRFAAALTVRRIQVLVGSPAIFELLVRSEVDAACLAALRICASSGGPIASQTAAAIQQRFGVVVRQVYGSSETGVIAVDPPAGGPPSVPLPTVSLRILDAAGRCLPTAEPGEIAVNSPAMVSGYVGQPEMTATVFRDGYFHTGDLGRLDSARRLTLLGRIRPVINISGTNVDPAEIEKVLMALPAVSACRVLPAQGPHHNQVIKAVIAVRENASLGRADVIGHCRHSLAEYKIPRIVELVTALPPDMIGKRAVPWLRSRD